jgi:hypothetical protein
VLADGLVGIMEIAETVKEQTQKEELKETIEEALVLVEDVAVYVAECRSMSKGSSLLCCVYND